MGRKLITKELVRRYKLPRTCFRFIFLYVIFLCFVKFTDVYNFSLLDTETNLMNTISWSVIIGLAICRFVCMTIVPVLLIKWVRDIFINKKNDRVHKNQLSA